MSQDRKSSFEKKLLPPPDSKDNEMESTMISDREKRATRKKLAYSEQIDVPDRHKHANNINRLSDTPYGDEIKEKKSAKPGAVREHGVDWTGSTDNDDPERIVLPVNDIDLEGQKPIIATVVTKEEVVSAVPVDNINDEIQELRQEIERIKQEKKETFLPKVSCFQQKWFKITTLAIILILVIILIAVFVTTNRATNCTMDLRQCPDGTVVGRDFKNNCEFKPCPDHDDDNNTSLTTVSPTDTLSEVPTDFPSFYPTSRPSSLPSTSSTSSPTSSSTTTANSQPLVDEYRQSDGILGTSGAGGTCLCPSGIKYVVADKYDGCESLQCEGGISELFCEDPETGEDGYFYAGINGKTGWGVVCAPKPVDEYRQSDGILGTSGAGGTCLCPSGMKYIVADNYDGCESLQCEGGISELFCEDPETGEEIQYAGNNDKRGWGVVCAPPFPTIDTPTSPPTTKPTFPPTTQPTFPPTTQPTFPPTTQPTFPLFDEYQQSDGILGTSGAGGTCLCPSGIKYIVADNYDGCESLQCEGGISELFCEDPVTGAGISYAADNDKRGWGVICAQ